MSVNKKIKIIGLAICLVLLGVMLAGCVGQQAEEGKVEVRQKVVAGLGRDPGAGKLKAHSLLTGIYEQLLRVDTELRPVPHLAESWEVCPEGKIWTFYLREGVEFHDGTPMDASAVKLSTEMFTATRPGMLVGFSSVEVVDEHTVRFHFDETFVLVSQLLFMPVVSPAAIEVNDNEWTVSEPVGTGPFKFLEHSPDEKMILVRNDDYWGGKPKLERVTLKVIPDPTTRIMALEAGEIDMIIDTGSIMPEHVPILSAKPGIEILTGPGIVSHGLIFNTHKPPFDDLRVRQAVMYAIDPDSIVEFALEGYGRLMTSVLPPSFTDWVYPDPLFSFNDQGKARELLRDAGWKDTDGDGIFDRDREDFKTTLLISSRAAGRWPYDTMAEIIQAQLRDVGILVEIELVDGGLWNERQEMGKVEVSIYGWATITPQDFLQEMLHSEGTHTLGIDPAIYSNPVLDELTDELMRTVDDNEAKRLAIEIQKIAAEDVPVVPIYEDVMINAVRDNIKGYELHPWFIVNWEDIYVVSEK